MGTTQKPLKELELKELLFETQRVCAERQVPATIVERNGFDSTKQFHLLEPFLFDRNIPYSFSRGVQLSEEKYWLDLSECRLVGSAKIQVGNLMDFLEQELDPKLLMIKPQKGFDRKENEHPLQQHLARRGIVAYFEGYGMGNIYDDPLLDISQMDIYDGENLISSPPKILFPGEGYTGSDDPLVAARRALSLPVNGYTRIGDVDSKKKQGRNTVDYDPDTVRFP